MSRDLCEHGFEHVRRYFVVVVFFRQPVRAAETLGADLRQLGPHGVRIAAEAALVAGTKSKETCAVSAMANDARLFCREADGNGRIDLCEALRS